MFKKSITSKGMRIIDSETKFSVGTKFSLNDGVWVVKSAFNTDNTEMRTIVSTDGTEEILTLNTLLRDVKSAGKTFKIIKEKTD